MPNTVRYEVFSDGDSHDLVATNMKDAVKEAREYLADGDWDTSNGESFTVTGYVCEYTTVAEDGEEEEDETDSKEIEVEIEIDEEATIRNQVGAYYETCPGGESKEGEHEWESTYEREGGCTQNPGVWSNGGTALTIKSHCTHCALEKEELLRGSQRNPGEGDRVTFSLCEDWDEKYAPITYTWHTRFSSRDGLSLLICTATKGSLEREATWEITRDTVDICDGDTDTPFEEDGWPEPPEAEVEEARELI